MTSTLHISPISIDLGAKNTGVYFLHYLARTELDKIDPSDKSGKVYQLDKDSYTLLMTDRTANRHMRRGFDRRQMAKRLFRLIWCWHFSFPWDDGVQQTVSFLMNRRGFSFLTEEYDGAVLSQFPADVYALLPQEFKQEISKSFGGIDAGDMQSMLQEAAQSDDAAAQLAKLLDSATVEQRNVRSQLVVIGKLKKLSEYCRTREKDEKVTAEKKKNNSYLSKWIAKEWKAKGVQCPDDILAHPKNAIDLVEYINGISPAEAGQILASIPDTKEQEKSLKNSIWNFHVDKFDMEKQRENFQLSENDIENGQKKSAYEQAHLHHLLYAIDKVCSEIKSGGRYRDKYFKEIHNVLTDAAASSSYPPHLRDFCQKLANGEYAGLDADKLTNLIGHISNLELKPLRKYFNDPQYKHGDRWDEKKIATFFHNWIWNEWRVSETDKRKQPGEPQDYRELKRQWQDFCGGGKIDKKDVSKVVGFWLTTKPTYTIPPYQDNNNRRPPRCQSFILNTAHLDANYPDWQNWCSALKADEDNVQPHLGDYEQQLQNLKSGKGKEYFGGAQTGDARKDSGKRQPAHLHARVLQYIFDRVKANDPLNLNEIYSHAKKLKQLKAGGNASGKEWENAKQKLSDALQASKLPPNMKSQEDSGDFKQGTFLHLICKYYKLRQRAKDGRIFIHPRYTDNRKIGRGFEATNSMEDSGQLLTYCNHKPRLKKYQMLHDIAGLLQILPAEVTAKIPELESAATSQQESDALAKWLDNHKGLMTTCKAAADMQKEFRGQLATDVRRIYGLLAHSGQYDYNNASALRIDKAVKATLKKSQVNNADKVLRQCETIREKWLDLTRLFYDDKQQAAEALNLQANPPAVIYKAAQLHNIAFKERGGNAGTCAICSTDNAQRMQTTAGENQKDAHAKAQRLPAIETRVFDGGVRRVAHIIGKAIAADKWSRIKGELANGSVCVPIIIESNRFEFEPNLREIKSKSKSDDKELPQRAESRYTDKELRIKEAAGFICPYTGISITAGGDIDHIIPRSSQWGTLNDEANLIYASDEGNKMIKKQRMLYLSNLSPAYKQPLFNGKTDTEIEQWIVATIGDGGGEEFAFGNYRSFINLKPDEQKAFRHALFLHPSAANNLRQKVIDAINNRTRTFVNGTQRYFAEVLANELHKLAKQEGLEKNLSFDFYSVEAASNSRGDDVHDLRKRYEKASAEISGYAKDKGKTQHLYSHLIDAMLAFVIAADAHRDSGGLKLTIPQGLKPAPLIVDAEGEIIAADEVEQYIKDNPQAKFFDQYKGSFLHKIAVPPAALNAGGSAPLKRRKALLVETHDREKLQQNLLPPPVPYKIHRASIIAEHFFPLLLSAQDKEVKMGFSMNNCAPYQWKNYELIKAFYISSKKNPSVLVADKGKIQRYLIEAGRAGASGQDLKTCKLLDGLKYHTIKREISAALEHDGQKPETIAEAINHWTLLEKEKLSKDKFTKKGVLLPIYNQWQLLRQMMNDKITQGGQDGSLQDFLANECRLFEDRHGRNLQRHNKVRKVFSLPVIASIGNIRLLRKSWCGGNIVQIQSEESLAKYGIEGTARPRTFLSKNAIPIGHYAGLPSKSAMQPENTESWVNVPMNQVEAAQGIISAEIYNKEAGRCRVRVTAPLSAVEEFSIAENIKSNPQLEVKITLHKDKAAFDKASRKNESILHFLKSEWRFFDAPFKWAERDTVKISQVRDGYQFEYTMPKTALAKKWLKGEQ